MLLPENATDSNPHSPTHGPPLPEGASRQELPSVVWKPLGRQAENRARRAKNYLPYFFNTF